MMGVSHIEIFRRKCMHCEGKGCETCEGRGWLLHESYGLDPVGGDTSLAEVTALLDLMSNHMAKWNGAEKPEAK